MFLKPSLNKKIINIFRNTPNFNQPDGETELREAQQLQEQIEPEKAKAEPEINWDELGAEWFEFGTEFLIF